MDCGSQGDRSQKRFDCLKLRPRKLKIITIFIDYLCSRIPLVLMEEANVDILVINEDN